MVIDAWMQHPTGNFLRNPMFASLMRWRGIDPDTFPDEISAEFTLNALEAAGVDKALVCSWWGPQGPLLTNDAVAALVRQYPSRFVGVASVDLLRPVEAVRELRRCVKELGFVALRLLPWLYNLPPNSRYYYPLYAECVELGIPFCLQVGHTGPLHPSEPGRPIPYLDEVALDFPDLTIVGGHIGYPWTVEMIALATKYPNVYIDTSAYKASRYPRELVDYMRAHGKKKVLFGSNFPMISPYECLENIDALGLTPEGRALFLGGNAQRVFKLAA